MAAYLLLLVHLASSCLLDCSCYRDEDGLYNANCSSLGFSDLIHSPALTKNYASIFVLNIQLPPGERGATNKIAGGTFSAFGKLKYLNLSNCSISHLSHNAFNGLNNLMEVDLSYNKIKFFVPHTFKELYSLRSLILRGNPIQIIQSLSSTPFIISKSLRNIDLGYCGLTKLTLNLFVGFQKLTHLILDGNNISLLKPHALPKTLRYVNLANNRITKIPSDVLTSLAVLTHIDLSGNPIHCDCPLMGLQDWLSGRGVVFENNIICASPPEYAGKSWSALNENELCVVTNSRKHANKKQRDPDYDSYFDINPHASKDNTMYEIQGDAPSVDGESSEKYTEVVYTNDKMPNKLVPPQVASQISEHFTNDNKHAGSQHSDGDFMLNKNFTPVMDTRAEVGQLMAPESNGKTSSDGGKQKEAIPKESPNESATTDLTTTDISSTDFNSKIIDRDALNEANASTDGSSNDTEDLGNEETNTKSDVGQVLVTLPASADASVKSIGTSASIPIEELDYRETNATSHDGFITTRDNNVPNDAPISETKENDNRESFEPSTSIPLLLNSDDDFTKTVPDSIHKVFIDYQSSETPIVSLPTDSIAVSEENSLVNQTNLSNSIPRDPPSQTESKSELVNLEAPAVVTEDNYAAVEKKELNSLYNEVNSRNENNSLETNAAAFNMDSKTIEGLSGKENELNVAGTSTERTLKEKYESTTIAESERDTPTDISSAILELMSTSPPHTIPLHVEDDVEYYSDLITDIPIKKIFESDLDAKNNEVIEHTEQVSSSSSTDFTISTHSTSKSPPIVIGNINPVSATEGIVAVVVPQVVTTVADLDVNITADISEDMIVESGRADREEINLEAFRDQMGSYILLGCIIIVLLLLLVVSLCKRLKSPTNKTMKGRTPKDIETNLGTEMQDMASLLPRQPATVHGTEKYPDEATRTKDLMKEAEALIEREPELESVGDVANNNKPLAAPRKALIGTAAAPIELTRARVGVIHDSIPRTPIFVHKRTNSSTNG